MNHIDERILELYVLGSEGVARRRAEIAAHLETCAGCAELAQKMRTFYSVAETELHDLQEKKAEPSHALIPNRREVERMYEPSAPAVPIRKPTRMERVGLFVRSHPITAGIGGATAFFGMLALVANVAINKTSYPAYVLLNKKESTLQVFDSAHTFLWQKPVQGVQNLNEEGLRRSRRQIRVTDLDGDGRNEVLTGLLFPGDGEQNLFRVFNADESVAFKKNLSSQFQYQEKEYTSTLSAGYIQVDDFDGDGKKEIIVVATNIRSPSSIVRLDANGNELGRYWHFGHLRTLEKRDVDGDKLPEIISSGSNDVHELEGGQFPFIVVLKPGKLNKTGKSATSPGFQLPFSPGELFYIQLPIPDMFQAVRSVPTAIDFNDADSSRVIAACNGEIDGTITGFHFVFDNRMKILEVKSNPGVARVHLEQKSKGRITSTLDSLYLKDLKEKVRYWDGKEWRKERVRVNHHVVLQ